MAVAELRTAPYRSVPYSSIRGDVFPAVALIVVFDQYCACKEVSKIKDKRGFPAATFLLCTI